MSRLTPLIILTGAVALGGCATALPTAPSVLALPPQGKDFAAFQNDDATCRYYAYQQNGGVNPAHAATQSAVGSAAVGTGIGAAAGALIGAAAGNAGTGAAIGAGSGLLLGSAVGLGNGSATAAELQQRYDMAYTQCMYAKGNAVQAAAPLGGAVGQYPAYASAYGGPVFWGGPTVAIGVAGGSWGGWGGWRRGWGGWHR